VIQADRFSCSAGITRAPGRSETVNMSDVTKTVDARSGSDPEVAVRPRHQARLQSEARPRSEPAPRFHTAAVVRELPRRSDRHAFDPTW
jgi:hypothetical protein